MSSLTIPVEQSRFNTAVPQGREPRNQYDVHTIARLSTFNMPRAVKVTRRPGDICVFDFVYPIEEHAERRLIQLKQMPDAQVKLGHTSRKVLSVVVHGARERLARGHLRVPLETNAREWAASLPEHAKFACVRNAEVIETILEYLGERVFRELADTLSDEQDVSGDSDD